MQPYAFFHKEFMPLSQAKIGILTHAFHYGTGCFEGIRANWNEKQQKFCIFRLKEHYLRLHNSCRILKIVPPYPVDAMCQLTEEVVQRSGYRENLYIRPVAYKSSEVIGVRLHNLEDDFFIIATPLPPYLAGSSVRCGTSSWVRVDDRMIPARGKICGIYVNSALAKTEAYENGYDEAILLTQDGHVAEGSGENIFLVKDNLLITPPPSDNILEGITRQTVMQVAQEEMGINTRERHIDRSELYLADECFFTGTAANIAPIAEIDHRTIGTGEVGHITSRLCDLLKDVMLGENPKYTDWYTLISPGPAES